MSNYTKGIFRHYFREAIGREYWNADNNADIEGAVDILVRDTVNQAVSEVREMYEARIAALEKRLADLNEYFNAREVQS